MRPDRARTDHHDPGGANTRGAAEEHTPAAVALLEEVGADLRGESAGHLAHGGEKGKRARRGADGLVAEGGDTRSR